MILLMLSTSLECFSRAVGGLKCDDLCKINRHSVL